MQKAYVLFGEAAGSLQEIMNTEAMISPELLVQSPKIARGENYGGLPYVMLDYPRYFGKEDVFAIRTMFWWGNFLSVTWHLKGKYLAEYRERLLTHRELLASAGFRVCINAAEWRHDFDDDNYTALQGISHGQFASQLSGKTFSKLAVKISLDQWNNATDKLTELYRLILEVGGISSRGGETGP